MDNIFLPKKKELRPPDWPQYRPPATPETDFFYVGLRPIFHCDAKKVALGPGVGLAPQRHYFVLGIPTCWYLKMKEFAFPTTQNIKFAFPPTQNPNSSQWNIGCIGSLALGLCVGHVHFIFFVFISFVLGS